MLKSFDKNHHILKLPILVTFLFFFMIEIQAYWI